MEFEDGPLEMESLETADSDGTVRVWGNFVPDQW